MPRKLVTFETYNGKYYLDDRLDTGEMNANL